MMAFPRRIIYAPNGSSTQPYFGHITKGKYDILNLLKKITQLVALIANFPNMT